MSNQEQSSSHFTKPNPIERFSNRAFGFLVKIGICFPHNFLLEVRGRKSGRAYETPVNVLWRNEKRYLVAPRGYTQWVKNVIASGEAVLARGAKRETVHLKMIVDDDKPDILKAYLDQYKMTVQRYFPIQAGSPLEAFQPFVSQYPAFEIIVKEGGLKK
ncbi:MAG: nitroreductase family deazaflavin-dependent oxidoreductase [Chloracidobacterium sp.]|nr:nitroreductase family deazaflavin-dependent oxidoreductase [Chloracidobacterium sp.]